MPYGSDSQSQKDRDRAKKNSKFDVHPESNKKSVIYISGHLISACDLPVGPDPQFGKDCYVVLS